jgi:hypothetical protein
MTPVMRVLRMLVEAGTGDEVADAPRFNHQDRRRVAPHGGWFWPQPLGQWSSRGQPPRPVSGWSSDQLMRFILLALILRERTAQSPDGDINLAHEGDKTEDQFFALIRQSLHNYDTGERFKARVVRALLELLHNARAEPEALSGRRSDRVGEGPERCDRSVS